MRVGAHPVDLLARHGEAVKAFASESISDGHDIRPAFITAGKSSHVSGLDHAVAFVAGQFLDEHDLPPKDVTYGEIKISIGRSCLDVPQRPLVGNGQYSATAW